MPAEVCMLFPITLGQTCSSQNRSKWCIIEHFSHHQFRISWLLWQWVVSNHVCQHKLMDEGVGRQHHSCPVSNMQYSATTWMFPCNAVFPCNYHTRALWLIQRAYRRYFCTGWQGNPSSFLPPNSGWWATSPSTFNGRSKWPTPLQKSLTSTDFRL